MAGVTRRTFITQSAAAVSALGLSGAAGAKMSSVPNPDGFGVHDFIENNPDAVFIMRTDVDVKTNTTAKKEVGKAFGRSVFVPKYVSDGGTPLNNKIAIKPNLTDRMEEWNSRGYEYSMGIVTDAPFVEGMIESMKLLNIEGGQFYLRETNSHDGDPSNDPDVADEIDEIGISGYRTLAQNTGATIFVDDDANDPETCPTQWVNIPDGFHWARLPYIYPFNAPDTFHLNIAKFKAHGMGITLTSKNLQGTCQQLNWLPYQRHCGSLWALDDIPEENKQPNWRDNMMDSYAVNKPVIPRWDKSPWSSSYNSGPGMEAWCHNCLDNNSTFDMGLHIVEGIYGRDGSFLKGPADGDDNPDGRATDYMTNIIIFGKNHINVDIIGHWLAGHEPGNFGLFHIARQRGFSEYLNPADIPLYEWDPQSGAIDAELADFNRYQLKTYYLQDVYKDEPYWHMVDEPFDYEAVSQAFRYNTPEAFVLHQNSPNPFNPTTSIEYFLPEDGDVLLEVINIAGQRVGILMNGYARAGSHMAVWDSSNHAAGVYFYRLQFKGYSKTRKMTLVR